MDGPTRGGQGKEGRNGAQRTMKDKMKRFALMLMCLVAVRVFGDELKWQDDYDKALAAAKPGKKIVMVDLYTDWCGWCKKLDRDVYANPKVQAKLTKDFVPLK